MEAVAAERMEAVAAEGNGSCSCGGNANDSCGGDDSCNFKRNGIRKKEIKMSDDMERDSRKSTLYSDEELNDKFGRYDEEKWDAGGSEQEPADWKAWDGEPEAAGRDDWDREPEAAEWNSWSSELALDESNDRNRASEKKKRRRFGWLIPAILLVVFVFSFANFMREFLTYQQAKNEYKELGKYIEVIPEGEEAPSDAEEEGSTTEDPEEEEKEQYQYPNLQIDYDGLAATNSEFTGVIYIPVLNLTYPIAQSTGNDKYLHTTFEGTRNASGCIFLDCAASKDFSDSNSFIFGHNMKNGTMFGSLKQFLQKEELCDEDPYIYIYQKDQVLVYRIFAYYTIPVRDDVYDDFSGDDGYDAYVADAGKHSVYHSSQDEKIDWSSRPNLLTLSTCYATGHVNNFIVQAALVENVKQ